MTVEEPKTTDTETADTTPEASGETGATPPKDEAATSAADADAAPSGEQEVDAGAAAQAAAEPAEVAASGSDGGADAVVTATGADGAGTDETPATAADETPATAAATAGTGDDASAPDAAGEQAEPAADTAEAADDDDAPGSRDASAAPAAAVRDDRPEPTTMEELLAEQEGDIPSLQHGDVVEGTIVRIDKDEMLVDVGAKSEGVVSNRELYGRNAETQPDLNVGDTVLVYVLQPESTDGHAVLSLRRAGLERKWRSMQEQFDEGVIIEAPVIDHNKGGLIVDCGIRGFVPISQIVDFPRRPQNDQPRDAAQEIAEKLQPYVGRKLRLKILEVNRKANRLILSEKVALYEERREKRDELFSSLETGQKVKGTVRSIAPFGIFVDLGGIDGLVHKSELSWNKVNNPEGSYEVGDEVEAEVIDINHERGRISLSIRRLLPDPWQSTVADLNVGDIVDGTVTKIVNFGAFVRVKDGLEGLIHISELSHQRVAHPGDVVHEGQTLKLKIISLDSERHRLGLSLKQAEEAPARPPARERRPRGERGGYDRSQAIQEPEGGIDNTLAAAFAQVRQQIAEQDADATEPSAAASTDEPTTAAAAEASSGTPATDEAFEAEPAMPAEASAPTPEAAAPAEAADADATEAIETALDAATVAETADEVRAEAEATVEAETQAAVQAETPAEQTAHVEEAVAAADVAEAASEVSEVAQDIEAGATVDAVDAQDAPDDAPAAPVPTDAAAATDAAEDADTTAEVDATTAEGAATPDEEAAEPKG